MTAPTADATINENRIFHPVQSFPIVRYQCKTATFRLNPRERAYESRKHPRERAHRHR
jgi:hypothetical protein